MQVEVYGLEESPLVEDPEQAALIELSSFAGQKRFLRKDSSSVPNPYRPLSLCEQRVFRELYGESIRSDKFATWLLPMKIMKEIMCIDNIPELKGKEVEVWFSKERPNEGVVVIKIEWNTYSFLGRWAENWRTFDQLIAEAVGLKAIELKDKANQTIGKLTKVYEDPESAAAEYFRDGTNPIP